MKVLQFTIPVPGENNIIVRHDLQPYFYQYLHRHDEIQLTWILKGEGTLVVDNNMYPFKSNEIYYIGGGLPHVFKSDPVYFSQKSKKTVEAITIHFNPNGKLAAFFDLAEMKHIQTLENFLNENLNESRIGLILNDLLNKMAFNTKLVADVLTIIKLAKEDKEGNAEKAVELLMKNHNLSKEVALEGVTLIFKKAFEWVK